MRRRGSVYAHFGDEKSWAEVRKFIFVLTNGSECVRCLAGMLLSTSVSGYGAVCISLVKSHPTLKAHWSDKSSPLVNTRPLTDTQHRSLGLANIVVAFVCYRFSVVICITGRRRFVWDVSAASHLFRAATSRIPVTPPCVTLASSRHWSLSLRSRMSHIHRTATPFNA